jgi:hypothetical protein
MRAGTGETELAFSRVFRWKNARPPSRFSSEIGTKADAKQLYAGVRFFGSGGMLDQNECNPQSMLAAGNWFVG